MFRLTALLCAAMFATLLIAGADRGQMRPGLARAVAQGEKIVIVERRMAEAAPAPAPAPEPAAMTTVELAPAPQIAAYVPPPEPTPAEAMPEPSPVFTLSALPSLGGDRVDATASLPQETAPEATPPVVGGDVWYVAASMVNVRQGPSTDASVVGKLGAGEAVTVLGSVDSEWTEIAIEGDGLQGFVATRFLSAEAP
ncbi:SH3 domain-containing protein [Pseudogemmobacter blasticus]|uniref:Peptide-binding protein n=1 Tax=Fuscovulum blasticum DSM 2131 TaxID=1188250 RepID=A0A2T4JC84_FUSBL|nr:SH3 domain-containing protein [Fuscovulum blasticum]PTE15428.1 peptide-binding protein [Fuscovulum blasticum DSM 2131]